MPAKPFVKSADTSTSAVNSRSQLDKMLRRYGAAAISMSEDIEKRLIVVTFIVPDSAAKDANKVPVKLPISISAVYHAMYGEETAHDWQIVQVAEMLVRLPDYENGRAQYTCRNLDESSGRCTVYETRPGMCQRFPYDRACSQCGYRNPAAPLTPKNDMKEDAAHEADRRADHGADELPSNAAGSGADREPEGRVGE